MTLQRKLVVLLLALVVFTICVAPTVDLQKTERRAEALALLALALLLWAGKVLARSPRTALLPTSIPVPIASPPGRAPDVLLLTSCLLC